MEYFQLNILHNSTPLWYFRWCATNKCKWHFIFLSVFFVRRSPPCHGAALFRPITLCFLSYSYFRHFGLNHYGPKPSWSVVPCGTRSASAEEMRMHSSEAAKVLGFHKSCARARKTCANVKPPPWLAHSVRNVSELVPARHMSYDLCICAHRSDTMP